MALICTSCGEEHEPINDKFKDVVQVNIPGIGERYYTVYVQVCSKCGAIQDSGTWVE